jgi:hypothetical protein
MVAVRSIWRLWTCRKCTAIQAVTYELRSAYGTDLSELMQKWAQTRSTQH